MIDENDWPIVIGFWSADNLIVSPCLPRTTLNTCLHSNMRTCKHTPIYLAYTDSITVLVYLVLMMTSSNGNIFRVKGPLWGESTGHRWIPLTKASNAELWCFLWSLPVQTVGQAIETPMIWDIIVLTLMSSRHGWIIISTYIIENKSSVGIRAWI